MVLGINFHMTVERLMLYDDKQMLLTTIKITIHNL